MQRFCTSCFFQLDYLDRHVADKKSLPYILFSHVVLKRFTIGQHERQSEVTKQQLCWISGGLPIQQFRSFGAENHKLGLLAQCK